MKTARTYTQTARAAAAAETAERILDAFMARARAGWMDQITLEEVARDARVTVQTVIRRFGGKQGVLDAAAQRFGDEVMARRSGVSVGDWCGHVRSVVDDYEVSGDFVMRLLAQEERWPALKPVLDIGRKHHRALIERIYAPWLDALRADARSRRIAALVLLTDVYAWRLLRRDQGMRPEAVESIMLELVGRLLGENG